MFAHSQAEPNANKVRNIDNSTDMYFALAVAALGVTSFIGVILCAAGYPIHGGIMIVVSVACLFEIVAMEVHEQKKKNPEMDTWTTLKEVLTPKCISGLSVN